MITFEEIDKGRTVYYVDGPDHDLEIGDVISIVYKDGHKDIMCISKNLDTTCAGCHYNDIGMCPCYKDDEDGIKCLAGVHIFKPVYDLLEEL